MATENLFASLFKNPNTFPTVVGEGITSLNNLKRDISTVEVSGAIEVASDYSMQLIRSDCVLDPDSKFHFDAMGALVTMDVGIPGDLTALSSAIDVATAGNAPLKETFDIADYGKRFWQLVGLSEDPGGDIILIITTGGATTSAGAKTLVTDVRTGQQ